MNRRRLGIAIWLSLSVIANGRVSAQTPSATDAFQPKTGQAVFLVAVRGDCGRTATGVINGREFIIPTQEQGNNDRPALDPNIPRRTPSNRTEPDEEVKKDALSELKKKFRLVDSPDKAEFVLHVCSRYLLDVNPAAAAVGTYNSRTAVRAMALTPQAFQQGANSYKDLWNTAWWRVDTAEATPNNVSVKKMPGAAGAEGGRVLIISGASRGPREVSAKDVVKDFVNYVTKGKAIVAAVPQPEVKPVATPQRVASEPAQSTIVMTPTEKPVETPSTPIEAGDVLSIETTLISVPVIVTDQAGKYIPGLNKSDFRVLEDGVEQQIEEFSATDAPFNIVLMIDSSGSARFSLEDIQSAAIAFVDQLRSQDSVMVVSFDSRVWVDSELTNDFDRARAAIRKTRTGMATRLYDAIYLVLTERLRDVRGRKAIVLFSDGLDQGSRISDPDGVMERAERQNTFIYTLQYESSLPANNFRARANRDQANFFMKEVASRTGGSSYNATGINDVKQAFVQIAEELRRQYMLGYYPENARRDGRYHQIKVVVNRPEVKIRALEGYQAAEARKDK
jgi:VWFA-related protein